MGKVLITGAPGNVGTEVVRELRHIDGVDMRIAAFDAVLAQQILGDDLDIVPFNFLDSRTYAAAFDGVTHMFLVRPPQIANIARDMAPALQAAAEAGVQHIVFLSIQGVEKQRVVPHYKIETVLRDLGIDWTFLRCGFFMQNLSTTHRAEIADRGEIDIPVGNALTAFIDVRDIAAVAARTLTEAGHENQAYTLTGSETVDYHMVAAVLADVLGRPIRYNNPSILGFFWRQLKVDKRFGYAFVVTMLYTITRFGNAAKMSPDAAQLLGRPPITFRQFVEDHRDVWKG